MRSTILATVAAGTLLAWGIPADVQAGGQKSTAAGGAATDTSQSGASSGAATPGGTTGAGPATGGATTTPGGPATGGATTTPGGPATGGMAGQVSDQELQDYVQARQQLEQQKPEMKSTLQSGDISDKREELQSALQESGMSAEEFMRVHRQVQADPTLRARVESQLGSPASGTPGTTGTGTSGTMGTGAPGSTGTQTPGAQPGASPQ